MDVTRDSDLEEFHLPTLHEGPRHHWVKERLGKHWPRKRPFNDLQHEVAMIKKAVIFDAFGTLVQIHEGRHPYRQILKAGVRQGRRPKPDDAKQIMTRPLGLQEAADHFGIRLPACVMEAVQNDLTTELASIQAYQDGVEAVALLKNAGFKVAVCSNLALPYADAVERLYPTLDAYVYSFEVGAVKPDAVIYAEACRQLDCAPGEVYMIGDSQRCDRDGPNEFGIHGWFLGRDGLSGDFSDLTAFAEFVIKAEKVA